MSKVYQVLAAQLERHKRMADPLVSNHLDRQIEAFVKERMPSGAGFDNGVNLIERKFNSVGELISMEFRTVFHHMDENGIYVHWTCHNIEVKPHWSGIRIRVLGSNVNNIREQIRDQFRSSLFAEIPLSEEIQMFPSLLKQLHCSVGDPATA